MAAEISGPQFVGAAKEPGLQIWRIETMAPIVCQADGKLYRGDSYIVLNSFESSLVPGHLQYDLHFWVGAESSEDEYGAAMFKVGELDRRLRAEGHAGAMHREVQDFEGALFLSYFPDGITYLDGGVAGIDLPDKDKEDEDEEEEGDGNAYVTRLFQVKGRKGHVMLSQVKLARNSLNSGDVFVLDAEAAIYQWNGESSNDDEKDRGAAFARSLANDAEPPKDIVVLDQGDNDSEEVSADFWSAFGEEVSILGMKLSSGIQSAAAAGDDDDMANIVPTLFKLKATLGGFASGPFGKVSGGKKKHPPVSDLKSNGVFLVDTGFEIYVWIGKGSSADLVLKIFPLTMLYLRRCQRPPILGLHMYREGFETDDFRKLFGPPSSPGSCARSYVSWTRGPRRCCTKIVDVYDPPIIDMVVDDDDVDREDIDRKDAKDAVASNFDVDHDLHL